MAINKSDLTPELQSSENKEVISGTELFYEYYKSILEYEQAHENLIKIMGDPQLTDTDEGYQELSK